MTKKTIRIQKGRDPYIKITALSEYARQRGWKVVNEVVTLVLPRGRELEQFNQDIQDGKIVIVPEQEIK